MEVCSLSGAFISMGKHYAFLVQSGLGTDQAHCTLQVRACLTWVVLVACPTWVVLAVLVAQLLRRSTKYVA